jgi:hypothetical protein
MVLWNQLTDVRRERGGIINLLIRWAHAHRIPVVQIRHILYFFSDSVQLDLTHACEYSALWMKVMKNRTRVFVHLVQLYRSVSLWHCSMQVYSTITGIKQISAKKEKPFTSSLNSVQRPNPKSLTGGSSRLWHRVKVDSGIGLPMVNVLESTLHGVTSWLRYSQLQHRVRYTMFFFGFGVGSSRRKGWGGRSNASTPLITTLFPSWSVDI